MDTSELLKNIGKRTGGDIYLGVVGPVRVGKSTFIKHFMQQAVIPYVDDEYERSRMIDELPQAGVGKTIMTTEPKFIPNTAANITFDDGFHANVRLVDCVGYVIPQAKGYKDEDGMRMVRTPWDEEPVPFNEAAKTGTQKVISDHSTIGIVITTDGLYRSGERSHRGAAAHRQAVHHSRQQRIAKGKRCTNGRRKAQRALRCTDSCPRRQSDDTG